MKYIYIISRITGLIIVLSCVNLYSFNHKDLKIVKDDYLIKQRLNNLSNCMFEILINTNTNEFDSQEKALISGSIKNLCNTSVDLNDLGFFSFRLSKRDKDDQAKLKMNDTFSASFSLIDNVVSNDRLFKNKLEIGESVKFEVKMKSLSWTDTVSSSYSLSSRQGIVTIPFDKYKFFLTLLKTDTKAKGEYKKLKKFDSNQIIVDVKP